MDNSEDENVNVTIQPSDLTIGLIAAIILLCFCYFLVCLWLARRGVVRNVVWRFIVPEEKPTISIYPTTPGDDRYNLRYPQVQWEQHPQDKPSSGHNVNVVQMAEIAEEEPSIVHVGSRTYVQSATASGLSTDEDGYLRIQTMLANLEELSINVLRSMILEDATSSSNFFGSDERGDESTVLIPFEGMQVVMKYPSCEVVSVSPSLVQGHRDDTNCQTDDKPLWHVESYSPMNDDPKVTYEESDTSRVISKSVVKLSMPSRTFSSRSKARTIVNIAESLCRINSDSLSPNINEEGFCTEDEDEERTSAIRQSTRSHEVSIYDSIVLANVGNNEPRHRSYLNIPNTNSSRNLRVTRISSKSSRSDIKARASEEEESMSNQRARARGEQVDQCNVNEDTMKPWTKTPSKSQKRSIPEKRIIHDTRSSEAKHYKNYPVNPQNWTLEEVADDSICLHSLSRG